VNFQYYREAGEVVTKVIYCYLSLTFKDVRTQKFPRTDVFKTCHTER